MNLPRSYSNLTNVFMAFIQIAAKAPSNASLIDFKEVVQ